LIAPKLEEIGEAIFGPAWREVFAYEFDVEEEDITSWETDASKRPADLEDRIRNLAAGQIEIIQVMMAQMALTGLRKDEGPAG